MRTEIFNLRAVHAYPKVCTVTKSNDDIYIKFILKYIRKFYFTYVHLKGVGRLEGISVCVCVLVYFLSRVWISRSCWISSLFDIFRFKGRPYLMSSFNRRVYELLHHLICSQGFVNETISETSYRDPT